MTSPVIEVDCLTKSYGNSRALVNVSLVVEDNEVFGFLGPNGAGKTTLIRLLMGLIRANSGKAKIRGMDVWTDSVALKRIVGYLPGELSCDPNLTGGQILEYLAHLKGGVDQRYLRELIDRFDLDIGLKFRQYSSGNKRKIGLIQAFMHHPRILLLDEPTMGLDPLIQKEFGRLVKEVMGLGSTVFLSSHVLNEVEHICTRVGLIKAGKIVHVGSLSELTASQVSILEITFEGSVPSEIFQSLEGVSKVEVIASTNALRVEIQGALDLVIKAASQYAVVGVVSRPRSLEEVFLSYYSLDAVI